MVLTGENIKALEKRYRGRLINSVPGAKSDSLIGTKGLDENENLALFSSVVHLGAHPALIGFVMRPVHSDRHTYQNIVSTGRYTINGVTEKMHTRARQTSAKYPANVSEFEACEIEKIYLDKFPVPFCRGSLVKIGCVLEDDIAIPANGTRLIVGRIELLSVPDECVGPDGYIDVARAESTAITGLDGYHCLGPVRRYRYAEPEKEPKQIFP
jgi:flavin reductase (DIM6/NTAB) family NADH-FMN oxidoreductase RutF